MQVTMHRLVCFLAFLGSFSNMATADAWPERPVRLFVTFPAGAANDAAARILADGLSKRWGKPVVVENRPGAEGTIGVGAFASAHDDHTLLYSVAASVTVAPLLIDRMPYDPERDLVPIVATTSIVLTVAVTSGLPARSLDELVQSLRDAPGQLAWSSAPMLPRFAFEAFLRRNGLVMNYVGYRDASQPQVDLGEGRIQVLVTSLQAAQSPVQSGKARFIAVTNSRRVPLIPDVPTADESGHPEMTIEGVSGLFGWRGMPEALRDRIAADVDNVLSDPEVRRRLDATGQMALGGRPADFEAAIAQQRLRIAEIARLIELKAAR